MRVVNDERAHNGCDVCLRQTVTLSKGRMDLSGGREGGRGVETTEDDFSSPLSFAIAAAAALHEGRQLGQLAGRSLWR
jgi:hypothetical protein